MRKFFVLALVVVFALTAVSMVAAQDDLGSEENPIQVYFVPSVEAQVIVEGGEVMADALNEATGLNFEVFVPTSYAAAIEAMCAAPESSMGFIPAAGYVIANNRCGVEVELAAVRRGWQVYWTQYVVRRDSDIQVFGDLEGRTWAYPDAGSTSGFVLPSVELADAGITPGEQVEAGGHTQAILAVLNGEADFATTFFSPPAMVGAPWNIGDSPEPYDLTIDESYVGEDGELYVGDIMILDARRNVRETAPDVIDQLKVLRLSAPIPNDTMSFSPDFPEELRAQVTQAIVEFSQTETWNESIGNEDFYGWTSVVPIDDSTYDIIRLAFELGGLSEEDVFGG